MRAQLGEQQQRSSPSLFVGLGGSPGACYELGDNEKDLGEVGFVWAILLGDAAFQPFPLPSKEGDSKVWSALVWPALS